MTTQQERLVELLAEFGIELKSVPLDNPEGAVELAMKAGTPNVYGDVPLYADFIFTAADNFVEAGVWE